MTVLFKFATARPTLALTMSLKRKAAELAAADAKKPKANGSITSFFGQPKTVSTTASTAPNKGDTSAGAAAPAPVKKFDKDAWVAKLNGEQKELLKLEIETLHESWLAHLKDEITSKDFLELKRFIKKEGESGKKIFPPLEDVYSWYNLPCSAYTFPLDAHKISAGPVTHRLTQSKPSSWVKIPTTTSTKPTVFASVFARPRPRHPVSRTSTNVSRKSTPTSHLRPTTAVCSHRGRTAASYY